MMFVEDTGKDGRALRVLMVEDSPEDAGLVKRQLSRGGYRVSILRITSSAEMNESLDAEDWDVVIADYQVPNFGALPALELLKQRQLDIPFIILSGAITDEIAVAAMRAGAHDYVLKSNLARLLPAIEREVQEAAERRRRRSVEAALHQSDFERRATEEALQRSEDRFHSMYQNAAVGIQLIGIDGRLQMVNPAICKMLGYSETELLGMTFEDITHPDDQVRERELLRAMLRGERESYEIEKRYLLHDGSPFWVSLTSSLVRDAVGRPLYRISIIQDMSEKKRAELLQEQLQQSQKLEAIGRLAGGIAHDFNTLLNIMLGYAELLDFELPAGDPRRERVEQIEHAAQTSALLTKQLLAFSRKQAISPQVFDLCKAVFDVKPMLRRLLREDIELYVRYSNDPCPVKMDPGQFQQVVLNLAANARDAMTEGGTLTIEIASIELSEADLQQHPSIAPGWYQLMSVKDTGIGMNEETAAHMFEPFFTTKEVGKGTGLGLASVYGIVKQGGGDIWVESELGLGSTFKVYLPKVSPPINVVDPRSRPFSITGTETILLVEDSAPLRQLTRELLSREGYGILEAADGVEALEVFNANDGKVDLLITDIVMPRMRGTELVSQLSHRRPDIAVVYLSGYTEEAMSQQGGSARITVLEKPYTAENLFRTVRQALGDSRIAA